MSYNLLAEYFNFILNAINHSVYRLEYNVQIGISNYLLKWEICNCITCYLDFHFYQEYCSNSKFIVTLLYILWLKVFELNYFSNKVTLKRLQAMCLCIFDIGITICIKTPKKLAIYLSLALLRIISKYFLGCTSIM